MTDVFMYNDEDELVEVEYTERYRVGNISNYYGFVEVFVQSDDKGIAYYWGIQDWDRRIEVEQISMALGNELVKHAIR